MASYLETLTQRIDSVPKKYWETSIDRPVTMDEEVLGEIPADTRKILGLRRQLQEETTTLLRNHESTHRCTKTTGQPCAEIMRQTGKMLKEADVLFDLFILAIRHELNISPQKPISVRSNWRVVAISEEAMASAQPSDSPLIISIRVMPGEDIAPNKNETGH